ncbi:hypothetical protein N7492_005546 [Penicillium capsulatum]|uniref:Uncharacterized protein n=1 Tax=Penicillium capsulatum TaxID=69766 RepID=A0A9W9IC50_9EURO|nr:hypothetical protein N7492_005546 [Penicillium capsulatum]
MGPLIRADMEPAIQELMVLIDQKHKETVEAILRGNKHRTWLWLRMAVELIVDSQNVARRDPSLRQCVKDLLAGFPSSVEGVIEQTLRFASITYSRPVVQQLMHIILGAHQRLSKREVFLALTMAGTDLNVAISTGEKRTYNELRQARPELTQLLDI